jgi:hypothetical protein
MRTTGFAAISSIAAGCAYHSGSFTAFFGAFPTARSTVGCIDIGIDARSSAQGEVFSYGFGNRCEHGTTLDLASVRVVGRNADGRVRPLIAYDPRHEIRPLRLEALWWGDEQIEYIDGDPTGFASVCVDVGGIDQAAARTERWSCL